MIGFLIAGLIIGALARLIKPGRQNLGILATLGLGLVGSLIGGITPSSSAPAASSNSTSSGSSWPSSRPYC